ncbi:hypothetical protein COT95_02340 [Candidatus Falkowbacteria bacterium CG10_big_fil_rev_8_21_14_0_10_37_6]|uniref:Uncharacterized protein n=1 Tax=Candidatus Falkowbacteria bacterium CG10_big_fil_rev_8_21_14_0_10_37_6 TaxID=1974563 RepID=A0A2H0V6S4_9BACT|nr:MAG: hypothetical protein COT95_02340 [Candidatus Falkowbacteria bacterium CG10_big_fil_rev_8_21_14_0_10_37_6]
MSNIVRFAELFDISNLKAIKLLMINKEKADIQLLKSNINSSSISGSLYASVLVYILYLYYCILYAKKPIEIEDVFFLFLCAFVISFVCCKFFFFKKRKKTIKEKQKALEIMEKEGMSEDELRKQMFTIITRINTDVKNTFKS